MTIWVFLWLILSVIILGASVWSAVILYRQKKAWQVFAAKHSMTYTAGRFMAPPTLDGFIEQYRVSFFTAERQSPDVRQRRFVTVVEIVFPEGVIAAAAMGTKEMVPFMETLNQLTPLAITNDKWHQDFRAFAQGRDAVRLYLTSERMEHVIQILSTKNADVLLVFNENLGVVRIETSDPILDPAKAEKVIMRLIRHAQGLKISKTEREDIKSRAKEDEPVPAAPQPPAKPEEPPTPPAGNNSASV